MASDREKAIANFSAPPRFMWCPSGKVPWLSEHDARAEADRLNAKPDGRGTCYTYHCDVCDRYHNGRPHQGKTLQ